MSEKIIKTILDDAQRIAVSTRNEGNIKAQEIISRAEADVSQTKQKNYQETEKVREDIVRQSISLANLDVRKLMLAAKRTVIDKAFDAAVDKILSLPKKDYLTLISSMLKNADDGDVVFTSKNDANKITADYIADQSKLLKKKITLSKTFVDIEGGIILSNDNYDKNFSLDVLLSSLRSEIETKVFAGFFED